MRQFRLLAIILAVLTVAAGLPVLAATSHSGATTARQSTTATPGPASPIKALYDDVDDPALERALATLRQKGALLGFTESSFRPSRAITVGEFAHMAAAAMDVTLASASTGNGSGDGAPAASLSTVRQQAIRALQERGALPRGDSAADPGLPLSRANLLQAVVRLAGAAPVLTQLEQSIASDAPATSWPVTFSDVAPGDPSFVTAQVASAIGVLPDAYRKTLLPSQPASRAEAALTLYRARRFTAVAGRLQAAPGATAADQLAVATDQGLVSMLVTKKTLAIRNGKPLNPDGQDGLPNGDRVVALIDAAGEARVVAAQGGLADAQQLADDLKAKALPLLRQAARQLTPDQWQAISRGDWKALSSSLSPQLYDQLMQLGVAPWEADALLQRDWAAVKELAKDRAALEAGQRFDVSPELLRSVLSQDWNTARQLAQQELMQRLLNVLLGPEGQPQLQPQPQPQPQQPPATTPPQRA